MRTWAGTVLDGSATGIGARVAPLSVMTRVGFVTIAGRSTTSTDFETAVLLDDRDVAVASENFGEAWRVWLRWSNLLGVRPTGSGAFIGVLSEVMGTTAASFATDTTLSADWGALAAGATEDERALLIELAAVPGMPVPELGVEVDGGIPINIAWPELKHALDIDLDEDDRNHVTALGWTLLAPDVAIISSAIAHGA